MTLLVLMTALSAALAWRVWILEAREPQIRYIAVEMPKPQSTIKFPNGTTLTFADPHHESRESR